MIPRIVPPLTGSTVLVTRPLPQARALAQTIASFGGEAIVFPTVEIEPLAATAPALPPPDWVIFASVHAVEHGARFIQKSGAMRICAIGNATARALAEASLPADIVPDAPFTTETLLAHPDFQPLPGQSVWIVRGAGGRETLYETLSARGAQVTKLEVYRRVRPNVPPQDIAALEARWAEEGIDAVTATSLETFTNLVELLTPRGRELLNRTPLLAPTQRILDGAKQLGWDAAGWLTNGADDAAIVGTFARLHARARAR